jgi:hypothetical protein
MREFPGESVQQSRELDGAAAELWSLRLVHGQEISVRVCALPGLHVCSPVGASDKREEALSGVVLSKT